MPEVRTDVADRNKGIYKNAAERSITKIYLHDVDANMGQVISDLYTKYNHFRKKTEHPRCWQGQLGSVEWAVFDSTHGGIW